MSPSSVCRLCFRPSLGVAPLRFGAVRWSLSLLVGGTRRGSLCADPGRGTSELDKEQNRARTTPSKVFSSMRSVEVGSLAHGAVATFKCRRIAGRRLQRCCEPWLFALSLALLVVPFSHCDGVSLLLLVNPLGGAPRRLLLSEEGTYWQRGLAARAFIVRHHRRSAGRHCKEPGFRHSVAALRHDASLPPCCARACASYPGLRTQTLAL